jgi:predicted Zn-dependent protease
VIYKIPLFALYLLLFCLSPSSLADSDLPEIGTVGSAVLTIEKEKEYGWAFTLMANQSLPIIDDPVLNNYISRLGQDIVSHADSVKLPFTFFLIEDEEINAAAFLGGNIKINTGLFLYADSESELASVIAHEIAHITQRHLARMLEQQSFSNPATLAAAVGSVLLSFISPAAGIAALSTTVAVNAQNNINYTRLHEYEADHIGIKTLADTGFDPYGMANFFGKLAEKYQYSTKMPEMLSTHPLAETRLTEARLRASQLSTGTIKNSLDYHLSKARITVRFHRVTPTILIKEYERILKNNQFQMQEAAKYGLALAYFQNEDYIKAAEINNKLLENNPNNLFYIDLFSDIGLATNNTESVISKLTAYEKQFSNNEVILLNLVIALKQDKQYELAEKKLALFLRANPKHLLAHRVAISLYKVMQDKAKEYAEKAELLALKGRFREASQEMGSALVYTKTKLDQARYSAKIEEFKLADIRLKELQK